MTIATFLNPFTVSSIKLALPVIGEEFGIDAVVLSWVPSAHLLSIAIFLLPAGRLGDILGRGRALGINVTAVYGGLTLGPFIGGILTQFFGCRSIFVVTILLGCTVLLSARRLPLSLYKIRNESFDIRGAALSAMIMILFFLGISSIPAVAGLAAIASSLLLLAVFLKLETMIPYPLFPLNLFKENRCFRYSNAAALVNYSATFAVTFLMSLYLQVVLGFGPAFAGLVLLVQLLVQMFGSLFAGEALRQGPGRLPGVCRPYGLGSKSPSDSHSMARPPPLLIIVLLLVVLGIGLALFSAPNTNAIMSSVERTNYSVASAMLATMRSLGMMMSMGLAMIFFALLLGNMTVSSEMAGPFIQSMHGIFLVFFVLTIAGAVVSRQR